IRGKRVPQLCRGRHRFVVVVDVHVVAVQFRQTRHDEFLPLVLHWHRVTVAARRVGEKRAAPMVGTSGTVKDRSDVLQVHRNFSPPAQSSSRPKPGATARSAMAFRTTAPPWWT